MPFSCGKRHFLFLTKTGGGGGRGVNKIKNFEEFLEQIIFIFSFCG